MHEKDIILNVPYLRQRNDGCAVTCLQMMLQYLGTPVTEEELGKELASIMADNNIGITPATARILVQHGHKVFFKTQMLDILDENLIGKSHKDIEYIRNRIMNSDFKDEKTKKQWEQIAQYIEAGGEFEVSLATLQTIDEALEKGMPVRVSVAPKVIVPDTKYNSHAVLVSGKRGEEYLINDPAIRFDKPYYLHKDKLLYAWYINGAVVFAPMSV